MPRPVALITGPTSGLGRAFARHYARDDHDLVIVARDVDRLTALANELRESHGVHVEMLPADLTVPADRARVVVRLTRGVDVLVNNAGFGASGDFWTSDEELLENQLAVNVTAVMQLTRAALPAMMAADRGTIINVASVAGILPSRSTYGASKAWVVAFTDGLASQLAGSGVTVHALAPGLVRTEFHERAGIDMTRTPAFLWLEVDDVVRDGLSEIAKGKVVVVPGIQYKILTAAGRIVPRNAVRKLSQVLGKARART